MAAARGPTSGSCCRRRTRAGRGGARGASRPTPISPSPSPSRPPRLARGAFGRRLCGEACRAQLHQRHGRGVRRLARRVAAEREQRRQLRPAQRSEAKLQAARPPDAQLSTQQWQRRRPLCESRWRAFAAAAPAAPAGRRPHIGSATAAPGPRPPRPSRRRCSRLGWAASRARVHATRCGAPPPAASMHHHRASSPGPPQQRQKPPPLPPTQRPVSPRLGTPRGSNSARRGAHSSRSSISSSSISSRLRRRRRGHVPPRPWRASSQYERGVLTLHGAPGRSSQPSQPPPFTNALLGGGSFGAPWGEGGGGGGGGGEGGGGGGAGGAQRIRTRAAPATRHLHFPPSRRIGQPMAALAAARRA